MSKKPKWIRIDEQKPPDAETVIVYLASGKKTLGFRLTHGTHVEWKIYNYDFSNIETHETVTHWLPMPPDPPPIISILNPQ